MNHIKTIIIITTVLTTAACYAPGSDAYQYPAPTTAYPSSPAPAAGGYNPSTTGYDRQSGLVIVQ